MTESKRINAKEAAQSAAEYYESVTNDHSGVLIEEVEFNADENKWNITLSHRDPSVFNSFNPDITRKYKAFIVDAISGEVEAMKIRVV